MTTLTSAPPTRTAQQLAMLDDDGNPHHPDEPDFAIAMSARIAALMRARPYLTVAVGATIAVAVGYTLGRRGRLRPLLRAAVGTVATTLVRQALAAPRG